MSKVLSALENTSKNGNKYYEIVCEGVDKKIISFQQFKPGDDIPADKLQLNDRGDAYMVKSDNKGYAKGSYQRNDELIVAQVAYKAIVDLAVAGKVDLFEKNLYRQDALTLLGTQIAFTIQNVAAALKGKPTDNVKPEQNPPERTQIVTVGQLFTHANAKWDLYRADVLKILGVADSKDINDLDAAWAKIVEAMEPK